MKVNPRDVEDLKKLPEWVRCASCRGKPTQEDWLLEIIPNSSALIHQSCAAKQGKLAGLNIGMGKGE